MARARLLELAPEVGEPPRVLPPGALVEDGPDRAACQDRRPALARHELDRREGAARMREQDVEVLEAASVTELRGRVLGADRPRLAGAPEEPAQRRGLDRRPRPRRGAERLGPCREPRHAERLGARGRPLEQELRSRALARASPLEAQSGERVFGLCDEGGGARARIGRGGAGEVARGGARATRGGSEPAEVALDRAKARRPVCDHDVQAGVRAEEMVEPCSPRPVLEEHGGLAEVHHGGQPVAVPRHGREVVGRQQIEVAARLGVPPELRADPGEGRAPDGERRVALGEHPQRLGDLDEARLRAPLERERDALDGEELHGVRAVWAVLDGRRLARELGCLHEFPAHEGAGPEEQARPPPKLGQPQAVGHLPIGGDLAVGFLGLAALEEVGDAPAPRDQLDLALPRPRRCQGGLGRERGALDARIGTPDREVSANERRRQHVVAAEAPRHGERLGRQRLGARAVGREVERLGEPPEEVRAQRRVGHGRRGESLLEETHEGVVDRARLGARVAEAERGAREQLAGAEVPGRGGGGEERGTRLAHRACRALGLAAQEEQPDPRGLRSTPRGERPQRCLAVPHRLLGGEERERPPGRALRVPDGALDVVDTGHGLEGMVGERGKLGLAGGPVQVLDRQHCLAMAAQALGRAELLVERVADEPVREPVAARRPRSGDQHPGRNRRAEPIEELLGRRAGEPHEHRQLELDAEDRREAQHLPHRRCERCAARADRLADAGGKRQPAARPDLVEAPLGEQNAHDLVDEQRVAARTLVEPAHDRRPRCPPGPAAHELPHVRLVEPAQRERLSAPTELAPEGLAREHKQDDSGSREPSRHEAQQQVRGGICCVEIVEHDDGHGVRRGCREHRRDRIEEQEPGAIGLELAGAGGRWQPAGELREETHERSRPRAERCDDRARLRQLEQRAEDLDPRPEGRRALFPGAAPEDARAGCPGTHGKVLGEPRLADAGLAEDVDEGAVPSGRTRQRLVERRPLAFAADERCRACHRARGPCRHARNVARAGRAVRAGRPPGCRLPSIPAAA